jgi:hypothetical protein
MVQGMASVYEEQGLHLNALTASDADAIELGLAEGFIEQQRSLTSTIKKLNQFGTRQPAGLDLLRENILIKTVDHLRSGITTNFQRAIIKDQFRIDQVMDNLTDAPFP